MASPPPPPPQKNRPSLGDSPGDGDQVAISPPPSRRFAGLAGPWGALRRGYFRTIDRYESLGARRPFLFSLLSIALLFALVFAIFRPGYDTNDDAVMNMIAAGKGFGLSPDEHIVFSNVLIGLALKQLYTFIPLVPWYGLYLLGVQFASNVGLLYCVVARGYTRLRLRLYLLYFAVAGLYFLNNLQFTSTAFITAQSGVLLCLLSFRPGIAGRPDSTAAVCRFAGGGLLFLASLIRIEVFYLVVGLSAPMAIVYLAGLGQFRRSLPRAVLLAAIVLGLALGCSRFNNAYYQSDSGWRDFYDYNALRVKFNDEAWVYYSPETKHVFDAVNWSENDFMMMLGWFYDDPQLYNVDSLRTVLDSYPWQQRRFTWDMLGLAARGIATDRVVVAAFLAFPLLLYCVKAHRINYLIVLLSCLASCALIGYLVLFKKMPPARVYVPTLSFPLAVAAFLSHSWPKINTPRRLSTWITFGIGAKNCQRLSQWRLAPAVSVLLLASTFCTVVASNYYQYRRSRERTKLNWRLYDMLARLNFTDDQLYICWAATFPYEAISPLSNLSSISELHLMVLGWPQKTPLHQAIKDHFGIDDLAEAIFQRPDLYLIAHPYYLGLYKTYVREHCGVDIECVTRHDAPLFQVSQAVDCRPQDTRRLRIARPRLDNHRIK